MDSDAVLGPFVRQLVDRAERQPFLEMTTRRALRPFSVVWGSPSRDRLDALEVPLRAAFDARYEQVRQWLEVLRRDGPSMAVLEEHDPQLAELVRDLTREQETLLPEDRWRPLLAGVRPVPKIIGPQQPVAAGATPRPGPINGLFKPF